MKVRILTEQQPHHSQPDRRYLASGEVVDIPPAWARDLLNAGEAEPVAQLPTDRTEKRPRRRSHEAR